MRPAHPVPYTAKLRDALLLTLLDEIMAMQCSPLYAFEHVRAITQTPLGTNVNVDVAEDDDSVGADLHTDVADLSDAVDDGRDVERVAFQLDYFGLWVKIDG